MMDLAGTADGPLAASLRPWINIMASLVSRLWLGIFMFAGVSAPAASAQVRIPFATGVTQPLGGLILSGTAINPQTGSPYRHLWSSDQGGFGLCRVDPDVETPGPHSININTCLPFVGGVAFKPGQLAFDPALNNIYTVDIQANTQGVFRLHYVPTADHGQGGLDLLHQEILGGNGSIGRNGLQGCPIAGTNPNSAVLGPDGNLYIAFKRGGNIVRLNAPQTQPFPCTNVETIGTTGDQTKNFGLGWIGHDLFGGDGLSLWIMTNADQCMTPQNGELTCHGIDILQGQTAAPTFVMTDQIYPATNGTNVFIANAASLSLLNMVTTQVTQNYATGFEFLGGLALDPTDFSLFAADDPTAGKLPVQGRWFNLGNGPANGGRPPGTLTEFASGLTEPIGGLILTGTAINPSTGQPYRHFWTSDLGGFGLCRLDPDMDSPPPHLINPNTCMAFVDGVQFKPGELAFDPLLNNIYAVDLQANTQGIFRLHYLPDGDGGHGAVDPIHAEVLGGNAGVVHQTLPGCGIPGNVPNSAVLGPDGNLYIGFKQSGNILRVISPQTEPLPCSNVQIIGTTPDNKKNFGLGFIGHDLFGGDGLSAWIIVEGDACMTPRNGNIPCQSNSILVPQTASPTYVITDQIYPALNGRNLFVGKPGTITLVDTINLKVTMDYATGFQFLSGMALDPSNLFLYAADDPSAGKISGDAHWWLVGQQQNTPSAPGVPSNVIALAGDAQATLNWTPAADGQLVTSYTVHNLSASNGAPLPDLIVDPTPGGVTVPTTAIFSGLTDGVTYQFAVAASNSVGTSAFSLPSNTVTPQAITVPDSPTGVGAQAGNATATVAWVAPVSNGGSSIISYTVSALAAGVPTSITAKVLAPATGALVSGLTNGVTYTFVVRATNTIGDSVASAPSNAVTPTAPAPPAVANLVVTVSGPNAVPPNSTVGYEILVSNNGSAAVPQVIITDAFTLNSASVISAIPSQGSCATATAVTCNLGSLASGSTAAIGITQNLTATVVNTASVQALDGNGQAMALANPASGTASVTTTVSAPPPPTPTPTPTPIPTPTPTPTPAVVTDLALNGTYVTGTGNGTLTWQVANLGTMDANGVVLIGHLPRGVTIQSVVAASGGSCTQSPSFGNTTRVVCRLSMLPQGQTWTINVGVASTAGIAKTAARVTFSGIDPVPANNYYIVTMANAGGGGGNGGGSGVPISRTVPAAIPRQAITRAPRIPDQ